MVPICRSERKDRPGGESRDRLLDRQPDAAPPYIAQTVPPVAEPRDNLNVQGGRSQLEFDAVTSPIRGGFWRDGSSRAEVLDTMYTRAYVLVDESNTARAVRLDRIAAGGLFGVFLPVV